ncbi:MAG: TonB-dependent receptor [Deltaproteobacteria bacterium]|nr:TonB-dependent receptor [Deltaproteobacteria bacterium]
MFRAFINVLVMGIFLFIFALPFNAAAEGEDQGTETPAVSSEAAATEDKKDEEEPSDVTVTATRSEAEVNKISADATVITKEDIEDSTSRTVPDVLEDTHGIIVRDFFGMGTKSTVDMRGFARGVNTAILVDGRKVNAIDLSGVDWNLIQLENVERIEVVRGTSSVLYGDNATSGVINIITKKHKRPGAHLIAEGSYRNERTLLDVGGSNGRTGINLSFLDRKEEGYRENSDFDSTDVNATLTHDLTDKLHLDLFGSYHKDTQGYPGYLSKAEVKANRTQTHSPQDSADYKQNAKGADLAFQASPGTELSLSYGSSDRSTDSSMFFTGGDTWSMNRDTTTDDIKVKAVFESTSALRKNTLTMGADFQNAEAEGISEYNMPLWAYISTTESKVSKDENAVYMYNTFNATKDLSIEAGYRLNRTLFKDRIHNTDNFGSDTMGFGKNLFENNAAKAGVTFNHTEGGKLFVSYATGFRLPTTDELFAFDGTIVPLKPEKTKTIEAGFVQPVTENISLGVTAYKTRLKNELYYNPFARYDSFWMMFIGENQNLDKTMHEGIEGHITAELPKRVKLNLNWTYMNAKFESGTYADMSNNHWRIKGNTIPLIPRNSGNATAVIAVTDSLKVSAAVNYVGKRYFDSDNSNTSKKLESYSTLDLKLDYKNGNFELYAGADNVFSDEHSEYGVKGSAGQLVYYPSPEISLYGGAKVRF